ncbi:hypothetical protein RHMOL_Rhmol01G0235200 [Rhododendron molle]|uniref:Uncharacterized protein n=1 Tax=Rhododendron molle TaxID=49168 RepID=A0ACC0Q4C9_RHOML|nr:hypothetical protein RHMOL_Rhmol01G0235200 [Rhododendron molle]
MAGQTELNELKKTVEEMSQKMDKMLTLVQGLVNLFTSIIPSTDVGPNDDVRDLGAHRANKLFSKVKLSEMFKDLAAIHDSRAHSKEDTRPLTETSADMHIVSAEIHEINPRGKRVCPVDNKRLYGCKASKASVRGTTGPTMNSQLSRRTKRRTFSHFSEPQSLVYEKLLKTGIIKPLPQTALPQKLSANCNPNAFCTFHQILGHVTDECIHLRHKIHDLIDDRIIPPP